MTGQHMKLIISPAKTLDFETPAKTKKSSEPKFEKEVLQLVKKMQSYSQKQIAKMMDLSEKLAKLNYERFEGWSSAPQKQAILAYMGDVYTGLDAKSFLEKDFDFSNCFYDWALLNTCLKHPFFVRYSR
jgi:cytoplasmic iron level regulating protein YaaA (DUF328/UPF0246 family)